MLLHFKFFSDYKERFASTVRNGQHYLGGASYGEILNQLDGAGPMVMEGDTSAPFVGSEDLYKRGFYGDAAEWC